VREAKAKALEEAGEGAGVGGGAAAGEVASKPLKAAPVIVGTKGSFQVCLNPKPSYNRHSLSRTRKP